MKTINIIRFVLVCFLMTWMLQSCDNHDVETYSSEHFLFFERWNQIPEGKRVRIDTVAYSFSNYVGETELVHPFQVKLIGDTLLADTEYEVIVVDSLTTALAEQYALPEHLLFRKGLPTDTLEVTIYKKASLKDKEVVLTLRLVDNENFKAGYAGYTDVKIRFNDIQVKPVWWDDEVKAVYLGVYSLRKLETVVAANEDFSTFDGLTGTEKRKVALNTKEYIQQNGITEEDGGEMIIPVR